MKWPLARLLPIAADEIHKTHVGLGAHMTRALNILIADDDADVWAEGIALHLKDIANLHIKKALTPDDCRTALRRGLYDVVLVDIAFSSNDTSGLTLVTEIQQAQPDTKIFMVSNHDDDAMMVRSLRAGALDFISKRQTDSRGLSKILRSYIAGQKKRESDEDLGRQIAKALGAVAESQAMIDVFTRVAIARQSPSTPVLVTGETGSGKEVVAKALSLTDRTRPFVSVDCGAIPETLAESEFFGHAKGAFTGADTAKKGKFQLADKGDLFLDEIGNLKRGTQEKLLRALQLKEITPVGGAQPIRVDVRVIAATNEDLDQQVLNGSFRQDLLERIRGIWIQIPPLRDRVDDIEPLIRKIISESTKPHLTMATTCLALLKRYSWPGNVRELGNVVREMIATVDDGPLTLRHLPEHFAGRMTRELNVDDLQCDSNTERLMFAVPANGSLARANDYFLNQYIQERIRRLGDSPSKRALAKDLQIARMTVDTLLRRLGIEVAEGAPE